MTPSLPYPSRLSLAQLPTPLQPLDRLTGQLTKQLAKSRTVPRIWLKRDDLTGSLLSGNKVRKLEFVIAQALAEGCDTLITCGGLQSNHCRATALVGAQLDLKVCLVLRGQQLCPADGNLLLDQLTGADIEYIPPEQYQWELPDLLRQRAERYRNQGRVPFIIPTGASDGIGLWGYIAASQELQADYTRLGIAPEYLVCATGSGGTHAGLTLGHHCFSPNTRVLGMAVCDDADYFRRRFCTDLADWRQRYPAVAMDLFEDLPDPLLDDRFIGPGYAVAQPAVFETIQLLARTEGVVLDPVYTGKAFYGLLEMLRRGELSYCRDIVFVHTGGLFGLFPQRNQLAEALSTTTFDHNR